jgi:hypothetical protein
MKRHYVMESFYRTLAYWALFALAIHPVHAQGLQPPQGVPPTQQIGQSCPATPGLETVRSYIQTQGAIECIPDQNGNYFWQPMGAGNARYDTTATCSVAGKLVEHDAEWNGIIQHGPEGYSLKTVTRDIAAAVNSPNQAPSYRA